MITVAMFPMHEDAAIEMAASLVQPYAKLLIMLCVPMPGWPKTIILGQRIAHNLQQEGAEIVSGRKSILSAMKNVDVALLASVPHQIEVFERVIHGGVSDGFHLLFGMDSTLSRTVRHPRIHEAQYGGM